MIGNKKDKIQDITIPEKPITIQRRTFIFRMVLFFLIILYLPKSPKKLNINTAKNSTNNSIILFLSFGWIRYVQNKMIINIKTIAYSHIFLNFLNDSIFINDKSP